MVETFIACCIIAHDHGTLEAARTPSIIKPAQQARRWSVRFEAKKDPCQDAMTMGVPAMDRPLWMCMEVMMCALIECIRSSLVVPRFFAISFISILANAHKVTLNDFHNHPYAGEGLGQGEFQADALTAASICKFSSFLCRR